jgi:tetratricopeptide (TPR) repeat protein
MSNEKPIRLVWGTPAVPGGRWHGGLINLKLIPRSNRAIAERAAALHAYTRHRAHLSLRGLLVWCLGLAAGAYFIGAAVVLHRIDSRTPHNRVGYLDLALPWRWKNLESLRGEALIAAGREALAAGRFQEGFGLLRAGLARHPADAEARLVLANIYLRLRLPPRAIALLLDGLDHGYPGRDSLETLFALLRDSDRPDTLASACLRARENLLALAESARPAGDVRWLDRHTVRALVSAGRAPQALCVVEKN